MKTYLITGCAGFIGSNFVHYMLKKYPEILLVNLDKLTYAGNLENLKDVEGDPRHVFVQGDICDKELVESLFAKYDFDYVINFAAESHVSQSGCQREAESATLVREYPGTRTHDRKSRHHCRKECVGRQRFRFSTGEKKAGDQRGDNLGRDGI